MFRPSILFMILVFAVSCNTAPSKPQKPEKSGTPLTENTLDIVSAKDSTLVEVKEDKKVFLNGEEIGTIEETKKLEEELKKIFETRKAEKKENPAAVYLKASNTVKNGDLMIFIEKLKHIGAKSIGLQIDEK